MTPFYLGVLSCALVAAVSDGVASGEPESTGSDRRTPAAPATVAATPSPIGAEPAGRPAEPRAALASPPLRIPLRNALLIAPRGCDGLGDAFDLLIHFHGAYTTTEPRLAESGLDAVFVVENHGIGSGAYEKAFASRDAFPAHVESIRSTLNRRCGTARSVRRVALSGWSAGYGAIQRILAWPENTARIDAVLLADGMHVGYEPSSKRVRSDAMQPFTNFAAASARGEKLMAVTHSAIVPPGYASTTETARFLADRLDLEPRSIATEEPRPGMRMTESLQRGHLSITGYAGGDARAHCDHLYAIDRTLWTHLRERWTKP